MRTVLLVFLLVCIGIAPCLAGTSPSITAQVNLVGDSKQYVYTLTNDLDSGDTIKIFQLWMPKYGATSVTSFTCSKPNWGASLSTRGDLGVWSIGAALSSGIVSGEHATLTLITPASVPTSYTYKSPFDVYPSNWQWGTYTQLEFGSQLLPVPVPEPSSILALAGGVAGLGGLALRRRRSR